MWATIPFCKQAASRLVQHFRKFPEYSLPGKQNNTFFIYLLLFFFGLYSLLMPEGGTFHFPKFEIDP
jgi:hypothetical protein